MRDIKNRFTYKQGHIKHIYSSIQWINDEINNSLVKTNANIVIINIVWSRLLVNRCRLLYVATRHCVNQEIGNRSLVQQSLFERDSSTVDTTPRQWDDTDSIGPMSIIWTAVNDFNMFAKPFRLVHDGCSDYVSVWSTYYCTSSNVKNTNFHKAIKAHDANKWHMLSFCVFQSIMSIRVFVIIWYFLLKTLWTISKVYPWR